MKPKMLITGGSKGIGKECVQHFSNRYEIISVSRNGDTTDNGDLTDISFLYQLTNKYPIIDVLINNAGGCRNSFLETNLLNYIAPVFLMEFYKKNNITIINIGSNASYGAEAYNSSYKELPDQIIWYCCSKNALKYASNCLSRKHTSMKICCLECGKVGEKNVKQKELVKTIDWIIEQNFNVHSILMTKEEERLPVRNSPRVPLF